MAELHDRRLSKGPRPPGPLPKRDYPDTPAGELLRRLHEARRQRGWGSQAVAARLAYAAEAITGDPRTGLSRHRFDDIEKGARPFATEAGVRAWATCVGEDADELAELWLDAHKISDAAKSSVLPLPADAAPERSFGADLPTHLRSADRPIPTVPAGELQKTLADGRPDRKTHRRYPFATAGLIVTLVAVLAVVIIVRNGYTTVPGGPSCADVGNRSTRHPDPAVGSAFVAAYQAAGGQAVLGCPLAQVGEDTSGFIHPWGRGLSQDFAAPGGTSARIMQLNPAYQVVVLTGDLNTAYTAIRGPDTAPIVGYPTSAPVKCGDTQIIELDGGSNGSPSSMALTTNSHTWIWLPPRIWSRYRQLRAGAGRLGAPIPVQPTTTSPSTTMRFEHGSLTATPFAGDSALTDREELGEREPATQPCPP